LLDGVLVLGGVWAAFSYLIVGIFSVLVITGCLVVILIALTFAVPVLLSLRALAWTYVKLFMRNKTLSSNVRTLNK
tara:strand:- start:874 stop:1101 length:228 start_codon:yes stop_codon:yes gene_type:complete